jgi:tetratricopeptide (TPR) repeat protein
MTRDQPRKESGPLGDRFARVVAVCTVLTTLAAAGIGYLEARALGGSGTADADAQQLSLDSLARQVEATRAAELQYDRFVRAQRQRRRAENARAERVLGGGDRARLRLEERRWERLARRTDLVSGRIARAQGVAAITPDGRDSPGQDPLFPARFFARHTTYGGERAFALRDAANEQDEDRSEQISAYSVTLAMFAIAVFLFGFSLTPEGRRRGGIFAGTAGLLAITGAVVALVAGLREPQLAPEAAADHYAQGMVALETGDAKRAVKDFDKAIELRSSFARAYRERSAAIFQAGSPQVAGYPSLTRRENLQRSNDDLRRALELGVAEGDVLASLGFGLFQEGLVNKDEDLLEEAVDVNRSAVSAAPRDPVAAFNLGVALLAVDREADAREAYRDAVPKVVFVDKQHRSRRPAFAREDILAGALTDLELLRRETGKRHSAAIRRMKAEIVGGVTAGRRQIPESDGRLTDFELSVYPSQASYLVHSEKSFDPSRDQLSLQWYHRDPKLGWGVLPEISGPAGSSKDDYQYDPVLDDRRFDVVNYLEASQPARCLRPGRYRLEAYLNGSLADAATVEASHSVRLGPDVDREVGMALCRPAGWRHRESRRTAGMMSSWRSPDGSRGAIVLRLDRHRDLAENGMYDDYDALRTMAFAMRRFRHAFPGPLRPGAINYHGSFAALQPAAVRKTFTYPARNGRAAGLVLAGAGYDADNVAWVGAVFGPRGYATEWGEGFHVFHSMTRRDY